MSDGGAQRLICGPFFDSSGAIYRGIKIDVYEVGTTSDKTYWTDEDKSTAGAHPLVDSDNDGIVSAFFDGDYRIRVKDSAGAALDDAIDWDSFKITSDTATMWEGNFGTSTPTAATANRWQEFAKVDGSNNFIAKYINDGTAFRLMTFANDLVSKTAAYTAVLNEGTILCDATSAAFTITLPTASGIAGKRYLIKKTDSTTNIVTIDGDGSETIEGTATQTLEVKNAALSIISDGTNWLSDESGSSSGESDIARYGLDTGTADAHIIDLDPAITAYRTGLVLIFRALFANATTTPTVDVNSIGAKTIIRDIGDWIVNGDFDADTDWTKGTGWTIAGGVATKAAGTGSDLETTVAPLVSDGNIYSVTFTISNYVSSGANNTITPYIGATAGTARSSNGTFTEDIISPSSGQPHDLLLTAGEHFAGDIDNVSVPGSAVLAGDIDAGEIIELFYDGVNFVLYDEIEDLDRLKITGSASSPPKTNTITKETIVKAWAHVTYSAGTPTLADNFNVSGIVDAGVGLLTLQWDTDFANATYAIGAVCKSNSIGSFLASVYNSGGLTTADADFILEENATTTADPQYATFTAIGDQ